MRSRSPSTAASEAVRITLTPSRGSPSSV
jgi:hypothetical protein